MDWFLYDRDVRHERNNSEEFVLLQIIASSYKKTVKKLLCSISNESMISKNWSFYELPSRHLHDKSQQ